MTGKLLAEKILTTCREARAAGQYIEVDFMLPSVLYHRDGNTAFHFVENNAEQLFTAYRPTAEQTGLPLRDVLLWAAQVWDMRGERLVIGRPPE